MNTPNVKLMLKQIPSVWHCIVFDGKDKPVDGVLMTDEVTRTFGDYGIVERETGDTIYVEKEGFETPQGKLTYKQFNNTITRRISSVSSNPYFIMITLGEVC